MAAATPENAPTGSPEGAALRSVLVVDDDRVGRVTLAEGVEEMGYRVLQAPDAATALQVLEHEPVGLVLTDLRMPVMDGMELLSRIRRRDSRVFVILVTAYATVKTAVEAMKRGAFGYVVKPIDLDQLAAQLESAFAARDLLLENISLRQRLQRLSGGPALIGHSAPMKEVFELMAQVADTESVVLIRGESGTGKELVANAIHRRSRRAEGPFVKVNCAALSDSLLESELFGHEEGAFTGAVRQRRGRFELADQGTLFLDEVSELAPTTQAKLLRVLQNFEFERLGGMETLRVDVRVLAATNTQIEKLVEEGRFRQDLYFRLNVVPVRLPPLRERREDIPLLVHTFIRRFAERNHKEVEGIETEALQRLMEHSWPGNVRELENCVERMIVTTTKRVLGVDDLPPEVLPERQAAGPAFPVGLTMKQIEERAIRATLAATEGSRKEAAKILGIGLRTLHRKIDEYGIERVRKTGK
ncbi:MAG: sigma-54-dependent transcriptional regulator [Candidatus Brocadiia bacterium]